jgi:hypothetical protein
MFRYASSIAAACLAVAAPAAPAAAVPPAPSGDWRLVLEDREPDVGRVLGFADAGTAARAGSEVRFWLEYRLEKAAEGADGYRGFVTGDCAAFTYGSVGLTRLAGARVVETGGEESGLTAAPGSNIRLAIDAVCARAWKSAKVDPVAYAGEHFAR